MAPPPTDRIRDILGTDILGTAIQCNVRLYLMYLTELGARLRLVLHTRHPSFDRRRLARYLSSVRRRVASHTQNIRASPPALVGIRKDSTCVAKKLLIRPISYVSPPSHAPHPLQFFCFLCFLFSILPLALPRTLSRLVVTRPDPSVGLARSRTTCYVGFDLIEPRGSFISAPL